MVCAEAPQTHALRSALFARVESVRETLIAGVPESLAGRTLAPRSVVALREAGLFSFKLPKELGGLQPDPMLQVEIIEALLDIAAKAVRYGGGQAIFLDRVLQRCLRDRQTAAVHLFVSDTAFEQRGQLMLGRAVVDPMAG